MRKDRIVYLLSGLLLVSVVCNIIFVGSSNKSNKYPLLAKRLFASSTNDLIINFTPLRQDLRDYIAKSPYKIGLYFEYLPTGVSININGGDNFYRASLVKLPGIMRTYKLIEDGKLREDDLLEIKEGNINSFFDSETKLTPGERKTIAELARLSLEESNNTAYETLFEKVNGDVLQKDKNQEQTIDDVYNYLDIPVDENGQTLFVSPKNYSSVLKSLYFSSYLNYDSSSKILKYLTESTFNEWLPKKIPTNILVAHKFGVFDLDDPSEYRVHSDCGIFYSPKRPYLLCVMAHHSKDSNINNDIADISKIVYESVSSR